MPIIRTNATKVVNRVPAVTLTAGDQNTTCLCINIERYATGTDLSELGWSIYARSAYDYEDVYVIDPASVVVSDDTVAFNWIVPQMMSHAVGESVFSVVGINTDAEKVWQSSERYIKVVEGMTVNPDYDPESASALEKTINLVTVEVGALREAFSVFEERMELAEDRANSIVESAGSAVRSAEIATGDANAAALNASNAASAAMNAGTSAQDIHDLVERKLAAGEFVGPRGPQGERGVQGADGFSVTHRWDGTTLVITSATGTSSMNLRGPRGDVGPVGPMGQTGDRGPRGYDGSPGEDGHTPEKGVDYMTSEDIDAMVSSVKNSVQPTVAELTQSMDGVTALLGQVRDAIRGGDHSEAANLIDRYLS